MRIATPTSADRARPCRRPSRSRSTLRLPAAIALASLCIAVGPSQAGQRDPCRMQGEHDLRAQGRSMSAVLTPEPAPIRVSEPFALAIAICPQQAAAAIERIAIDASMPLHRHGMNYRATIRREGVGRYRAHGLLLHMPGRWRFELELHAAGVRDRLRAEFELR